MMLVCLNAITGIQKNGLKMCFPTLKGAIQHSIGNPPEVT